MVSVSTDVPVDVLLALVAGLWGALTGLLVPRAAHRFSADAGQAWRTECPSGHPLTGAGRGWLGRARCAVDGEWFGPGTPAVCVATALVCVVSALATGPRPELAVWLLLAPVGVLLTIVDHRVMRLPDVLTLPFAAVATALLGVASLLPEAGGSWTHALLGTLVMGGVYFVFFLISPEGMAFGDVKLALGLGAALGWYGWGVLFLGMFLGLLLAGLYGIGLVVLRGMGRKTAIAFGPFLIAGAWLGVLLGAYAA